MIRKLHKKPLQAQTITDQSGTALYVAGENPNTAFKLALCISLQGQIARLCSVGQKKP